jgi:hypothetical protein
MKKCVLYTLLALIPMVSTGAYAEETTDASATALTTKGYVDAGLKYVYDANKGDIKTLSDKVGDTTMTTTAKTVTGAINELNKAIDDIEKGQEYTKGTGIDITQDANGKNVVSLDLGETDKNTTYVFKTNEEGVGTWQTMEVEDSWSPGFLTE